MDKQNPSEIWRAGQRSEGSPLIPCVVYENPRAAIRFLVSAFGLREHLVVETETEISHAELTFGYGMVMLGTRKSDNFEPAKLYLVVEDADAHCATAKAAGARILREPEDRDYGGRDYTAVDPEGHQWTFGTYDPWAAPPALDYQEDDQAGIIELRIAGKVRGAEFEAIVERMEAFFERHEKVRLIEIIENFEGMDLSILFDDVLFSLRHLSRFSHVAVVTDLRWAERMANAAAVVLPARLRVFSMADLEEARQWAKRAG